MFQFELTKLLPASLEVPSPSVLVGLAGGLGSVGGVVSLQACRNNADNAAKSVTR